ncbi:MAG TPA: Crp/Fnr family transcriptional regulator [Candidatus Acidoferrales bacterium]|nr:Crp/Fnr family transcriptional regulator [Candidatus Acidoferrales bacterium]
MSDFKSRLDPNNVLKANGGDGNGRVTQNKILLSLPGKEFSSVFPALELQELPTHVILNEMSEPIEFAYFIESGLASVLNVMQDGKSVEVGLTGSEGFVGIPLLVGFNSSPSRVVMQIEGSAFKISAKNLAAVLSTCPKLERSLLRFSQELAVQAAQVAACNRLHEVDERLARWLLMSQDRVGGDIIRLTQEFLAHMLGTRRASVTVAAGMLQKAGLIKYSRGEVIIVNRKELEDASCECYGAIKRQSQSWQNEAKK